MNPFDLPGPEFLVFYAVLAAGTILAVWWIRHSASPETLQDEREIVATITQDPYQIAFLRGGAEEVVRVAIVSLIERDMLVVERSLLSARDPKAASSVRRPLDKAILSKLANERAPVDSLFFDRVIMEEANATGEPLRQSGAMAGEEDRRQAHILTVGAMVVLWGVAGAKILVALARGRHNVLFLLFMAALAPLAVRAVTRRVRTPLGDRVCRRVKEFYSGLWQRRASLELTGSTGEMTFLAATFGLAVLPEEMSAILEPAGLGRPERSPANAWMGSCGSSCSTTTSSCSSGSSSSGGSSCGGCGG